jgi:hypothetical protein
VISNPVALDEIAFERDRALLELRAEDQRRHGGALLLQRRKRFTDGIQHIADLTGMGASMAELNGLLPFRDRRQTEELKPAPLQQEAGQIIEMENLVT